MIVLIVLLYNYPIKPPWCLEAYLKNSATPVFFELMQSSLLLHIALVYSCTEILNQFFHAFRVVSYFIHAAAFSSHSEV